MQETRKRDFDAVAATWDEAPARAALAKRIVDAIVAAAEPNSSDDVLDVGCGTGLVTLALQPIVRSVTGVDGSEGMLNALRAKVSAAGLSDVRVEHLELEASFPLPGRYHLVVSSMTLHHVRDVPALLLRLFDALHPGGRVALADLYLEDGTFHEDNTSVFHFGFAAGEIEAMLVAAGFEAVAVTQVTRIERKTTSGTREFPVFLAFGRKPA